jgi:hypothetical protein
MAAYVEEKFELGFILDEAKLRKIADVIESRTSRNSLLYKVFRGDSYSYETIELGDVIQEDNDIKMIDSSDLDFSLVFSRDGLSISITGEDRDSVFLLYSDLKEYIKNQVLKSQLISYDAAPTVGLFISLTALSIVLYYMMHPLVNIDKEYINQILSSGDIHKKIDYMIYSKLRNEEAVKPFIFPVLMFIPFVFSARAIRSIMKFVSPTNVFLFGHRKFKYEDKNSLISKIFWGVIVATCVSIVAGYFLLITT